MILSLVLISCRRCLFSCAANFSLAFIYLFKSFTTYLKLLSISFLLSAECSSFLEVTLMSLCLLVLLLLSRGVLVLLLESELAEED